MKRHLRKNRIGPSVQRLFRDELPNRSVSKEKVQDMEARPIFITTERRTRANTRNVWFSKGCIWKRWLAKLDAPFLAIHVYDDETRDGAVARAVAVARKEWGPTVAIEVDGRPYRN